MTKPANPASGAPASDLAGRMAGEYRIGRKLGEGGFGAVYEAEHPLLKRRAAVKVLHRDSQRNADAVARFAAEAQAVNQIRSHHIVDIFSFGQLDDGRHFYVMDLLEGEPLDRRLARVSRIELVPALQLLRQVADALDVAHAAGIVHRDLKPQNIFLTWTANGETVLKLLDFGMAKLLDDSQVHTVTGTPVGTPLYMSPEQALGGKVDGRADVYALGILTHELLTGHRPITGENLMAVLVAHISQSPPRVSAVATDLPAALDEPVLAMLHKNPEERPLTAGEALDSVIRAAESSGSSVPAVLPHLERPPPRVVVEAGVAPTGGFEATMSSPGGVARSSAVASNPRSLRWLIAAVLVALGSGVSYLVARGPSGESVPSASMGGKSVLEEPSSVPPVSAPSAALVPPVSQVEVAPSASVPPPASASSAAPPPRARKRGASPPAGAIPHDLESPF